MQENEDIILRSATLEDAPFIAYCLMEALGGRIMEHHLEGHVPEEEAKVHAMLTEIARRDDTLYTWRFATIAQTREDTPVGASLAYDGRDYHERRIRSFSLAQTIISFDIVEMEDEAGEGEFYLDTLAVLPNYRGRGIGHLLLRDWLLRAEKLGLQATLIYHPKNLVAKKVYESMGMRDSHHVFVFGDDYMKMVRIAEKNA